MCRRSTMLQRVRHTNHETAQLLQMHHDGVNSETCAAERPWHKPSTIKPAQTSCSTSETRHCYVRRMCRRLNIYQHPQHETHTTMLPRRPGTSLLRQSHAPRGHLNTGPAAQNFAHKQCSFCAGVALVRSRRASPSDHNTITQHRQHHHNAHGL